MKKTVKAVLDACVLYPAPLRDLLMHLAVLDVFQARWTEQIHDEWIRNVLINRPDLKPAQLERTRQLMNSHTRDAVVANYENLIDSLKLPDENDRHVLAAAIHTKADLIVTFNLRDFSKGELSSYNIRAVHPDIFIKSLFEEDEELVFLAAQRQWQSLKNPPKPLDEFLEVLEANGIEQTVKILRLMFDSNP
jgi:predicted nucleic acid-binding protein